MYQSINYYINPEPQKQAAAEAKAAYGISQRFLRNQRILLQTIPNLAPLLQNKPIHYELIVNANQSLNICLKAAGVVLYGQQPAVETNNAVQQFLETRSVSSLQNAPLVISGIGLGYHLLPLVQHLAPSYLLIYEPEPDLFLLSLKTSPWFELLTLCQTQGIHVFLQIGENANNLLADLKELQDAFPCTDEPLFYQHLNHPTLDRAIYHYYTGKNDCSPAQSPVFLVSDFLNNQLENKITPGRFTADTTEQHLFSQNIRWLATHMPALHNELIQHSWRNWQLHKYHDQYSMQDNCGRIYSVNHNKTKRGKLFHHFALFDPMVFDYSLPDKLLNTDFATLFSGVKNIQRKLISHSTTDTVSVCERILLGTADYQACLAALANSNTLLVLEPDTDFLFASLFTVPWYQFDGLLHFCRTTGEMEQLIQRLFQQHRLNLTDIFLDHPYYEQGLRQSYHTLLELIQSSNGKANYFEKQLNSLKHLHHNLASAYYLSQSTLSVSTPIFIIGNGPSLNSHLEFLLSNRGRFILISCGTALITLYRSGITPNYHVELERGSDTLYYLQQVPAEYLKRLILISPADQHPDVINVFSKALLVFLSQTDITDLFRQHVEKINFRQLTHSYYTVTNFAVDLFLSIGGKTLYLLGVDFGFKHINAHHASNSVYFQDNGNELYDFEHTHGAAYEVEANFGGNCLTVPPFDIARKLMVERIALAKQQIVYNCNDGAFISGAKPLRQIILNNGYQEVDEDCHAITNLFVSPLISNQDKANLLTFQKELRHFLHQLLHKWEQDLTVNMEYAVLQQRQCLENEKQNSECAVHILMDGTLRYLEMVYSRLKLYKIDQQTVNQLAKLWHTFLQQSLRRVE